LSFSANTVYRDEDQPEFIAQAQTSYPAFEFRLQNVAKCTESFDWCVLLGVVNAIPNPRRVLEVLELSWQRCQRGMLVDFVDQEKLAGPVPNLNSFDLGECASTLLEFGAEAVEVYTTPNTWSIFLARKQSISCASMADFSVRHTARSG
jgi:hypothetical protein